ncbi:MAG: response regulator [Alphaproteobacteria bacterium]|nr:response regulator [Alphaproteobacteria bacterium]
MAETPNTLSCKKLGPTEFGAFVDFACQMRRVGKDASFIHIRGATEKSKVNLPEIMQMMETLLKTQDAVILENTPKNEVLIAVKQDEDRCKNLINGTFYTRFSPHSILASVLPFNDRGTEHLARILDAAIPSTDFVGRLGYTRLSRKGNVFLVLDDDPMILKQMEHILQPLGMVETAPMAEEFLHKYKRAAPNCVFIDVHLRTEKGTDLAGVLRKMLDPFAYIIIISSDTVKENIIETKVKGGNGFVGKPLNRDLVTRAAQACNSFIPKK